MENVVTVTALSRPISGVEGVARRGARSVVTTEQHSVSAVAE